MSLIGALSVANGSLANINRQFALVSQNIANANTPGYAAESATQQSLTAEGVGLGVRSGPATRNIDTALQSSVLLQNADVAGLQTRQAALSAIDSVHGTPGSGTDLASLVGDLQNQFSALLNDPGNVPQQSQVVSGAANLADGINQLADTYGSQRQAAQNDLVSAVDTLNTALGTIGQLSNQIIAFQAGGRSTADLENQRDAVVQTVSQLVQVRTLVQPNGDMLLFTTGGLALPTRGGANPLHAAGATLGPASWYPGDVSSGNPSIPAITLNGADVTGQLTGGRIGADITLRDTTLPTFQAELDEFAQKLASRFQDAGVALFTDANGAVPAESATSPPDPVQQPYVGFANGVQVNPDIRKSPELVRDGTVVPPPSPLPDGYADIISNVLTNAFGSDQVSGAAQPGIKTRALGPGGNLDAPFGPDWTDTSVPQTGMAGTLGAGATTLVAAQEQTSADVSSKLDTQQALQSSLAGKLAAGSAVNMDTEMSLMIQLQNSYAVSARVISTVQTMWTQLLNAVQ